MWKDMKPEPTPVSEESDSEEPAPVIQKANATYKTCDGAIRRMEDEQKMTFKHGTTQFSDKSFQGVEAEYWDYQVNHKYYAGMVKTFKGAPNWKRVHEMDKQPSLWGRKGAHEHGINQGALGDCWFLAGISSLAEHGERVEKLFDVDSYPSDGLFNVKLWSMGKEYTLAIDDRIPVQRYFGTPFMTRRSPNGAWWGTIIEKVAAKYWGNYTNMHGGNVWEAFYMLTGMPAIAVGTTKVTADEMWSRMVAADKAKYPMSASANVRLMGIVGGHAYTLLGVATVDGNRLIKMRNPWGRGEYNGPWSDKSAEMKKAKAEGKITHVDANDGSFYVPVDTFRKAYYQFTINYYQDW